MKHRNWCGKENRDIYILRWQYKHFYAFVADEWEQSSAEQKLMLKEKELLKRVCGWARLDGKGSSTQTEGGVEQKRGPLLLWTSWAATCVAAGASGGLRWWKASGKFSSSGFGLLSEEGSWVIHWGWGFEKRGEIQSSHLADWRSLRQEYG